MYVLKPSEMTHADDCCAPWQMRPVSKQQQQTAIRRPISPCPLHKAVCLGTKHPPPPPGIKVLQLPPTLLTHTQRCRRTEVVTVMSPGMEQNPFHRSPTERVVRGTEACSEQWSLTKSIFCFSSLFFRFDGINSFGTGNYRAALWSKLRHPTKAQPIFD